MTPILFDRARLRKRRERAAAGFAAHDFLRREAVSRVEESLGVIRRTFPRVACFGAALAPRTGTATMIHADLTPAFGAQLVADEEALPFAENSLDAVVSVLSLHWVNDLPGALVQMRRALKPDGLLLAILFGAETLRELRQVFAETETALSGGVTPRVAPFVEVREAGNLLQRAGFALPVTDSDVLQVSYADLPALMEDLRGMGEVNMLHARKKHFTSRGFFANAAKLYAAQYGDAEGRIPASFEFVTLTAWKPDASQQQPARRGSGQVSLAKALH